MVGRVRLYAFARIIGKRIDLVIMKEHFELWASRCSAPGLDSCDPDGLRKQKSRLETRWVIKQFPKRGTVSFTTLVTINASVVKV